MKIDEQSACSYRQIQEVIALIPAATHEIDADARPDPIRAARTITAAVTGESPALFFAVAEVDGATAGFLCGHVADYAFESRRLAQDVLLYVVPQYRGSGVTHALVEAFARWGASQGASHIRIALTTPQAEVAVSAAVADLGFTRLGSVLVRKEVA